MNLKKFIEQDQNLETKEVYYWSYDTETNKITIKLKWKYQQS